MGAEIRFYKTDCVVEGSGDIAFVLNERPRSGALFFAAGVSNSRCIDEYEYYREKLRLEHSIHAANNSELSLFYFGTISSFFTTTRYTKHKEEMEQLIKDTCNNYNIIRIGNITWGSNPNTFINYIRDKKAKGEPVEIRDEWKYLISKDELLLITDNLPLTGKNEISVFGKCKKVIDCL